MIGARRINAVLIRDDLPELGTDLVATPCRWKSIDGSNKGLTQWDFILGIIFLISFLGNLNV